MLLALILEHAKTYDSHYHEFEALMQVWTKVKQMETLVKAVDYRALYYDLIDKLLDQDARPAPEEPEEVQIDQHTFVSEKDAQAEIEALKAEADKGSEAPRPGSWARRELDRKFKQAVVERIREARKMGIGSEVIAQNSRGQGVTGDAVRQILEAQAVDVRKYRKIDEALDRLGVPKAQEETDEQKEE
ncbi:MAG: hypothetical protein IKE76_01790 [Clostridia bacterium]|nr:hypothetical protein [Clostridia bacterium]